MDYAIKYLVMDVDGTLTDGKIYMGNNGEAMKAFNVKDGCGIHDILIPAGIIPVVITRRQSFILENRCRELGIVNLYQGIEDKEVILDKILSDNGDNYLNVAYIGDDINDLSCMRKVKAQGGVLGCPADSVKEVIEVSNYVCKKNGGDGAVREFIEWFMR